MSNEETTEKTAADLSSIRARLAEMRAQLKEQVRVREASHQALLDHSDLIKERQRTVGGSEP
jgi:hypothetical protein